MMQEAKENRGFVDQTEFKTAQQYTFDSLIFDETSTRIIDDYVMHIRPLLNPQCDNVLITRSGTQIKNFSILMSKIVFAAIGKYVHPTRYPQILETENSVTLWNLHAARRGISKDSSAILLFMYASTQP